jgi:N-acyl-D-amino-acid deacylase
MTMSARVLGAGGALLGLLVYAGWPAPAVGTQRPEYDVVITNGLVLDGSGQAAVRADVAIRDGLIAAVGSLGAASSTSARATETIDAAGRYVTPGFIDVHSHAAEGLGRDGLEQGRPVIAQGITTIVANPDGGGPITLKSQRESLEKRGLGPNVALLIGHGSVRNAVLGMSEATPGGEELERMKNIVRHGMEDGAFGLSSGLFYAPGSYAKTEEVIALAKVVSEFGGLYTSHIRDEGDYSIGVIAAVDEVIRIAEEGGVTGIVSHMKALGPDNWGKAVPLVQRIEAARARGVKVFADQYPYDASSTSLTGAVIPRWAQVGGNDAMRQRIAAEDTRAKMIAEVRENIRRRGGPRSLVVAHYAPDRAIEGKDLGAIAAARNMTPEATALDLVSKGGVSIVSFNMSEDDIALIMRQPWTMTSSDGGLVPMTEGVPHPRNYGAFSRKIARYVRERKVVTLETAVRSMTGLSAEVMGIPDRGVLRKGAAADVVIFDPAAVRDAATYTQPHQLAEGMWYVFVNGVPVIAKGAFTEAKPGRVLLKPRKTEKAATSGQ